MCENTIIIIIIMLSAPYLCQNHNKNGINDYIFVQPLANLAQLAILAQLAYLSQLIYLAQLAD